MTCKLSREENKDRTEADRLKCDANCNIPPKPPFSEGLVASVAGNAFSCAARGFRNCFIATERELPYTKKSHHFPSGLYSMID